MKLGKLIWSKTFYGWDKVGAILSDVCGQDGEETLQLLILLEGLQEHVCHH